MRGRAAKLSTHANISRVSSVLAQGRDAVSVLLVLLDVPVRDSRVLRRTKDVTLLDLIPRQSVTAVSSDIQSELTPPCSVRRE